jgi:hypothetical protein
MVVSFIAGTILYCVANKRGRHCAKREGHSRPDILLKVYAHVLDASADMAAETLSGHFGGVFSTPMAAHAVD